MNSHLLPLFISYRSSGEKSIKYQANSSCVIISLILMTTLFYKAVILQGEIWCWPLLGIKGKRKGMKRWLPQGSPGRLILSIRYNFLHINEPKKAETDSRGMGLCYIVQPGNSNWPWKALRDWATKCNFQSYVQIMLYKTCTVGFLKRFFNARDRINFRKLKLDAICFSLISFVLLFRKLKR